MALSSDTLRDVVQSYMLARTWESKKRVVLKHTDILLSKAFDESMAFVIERMREANADPQFYQDLRTLLMRCRLEGIDAAFVELLPLDTPEQRLRQLMMDFIDWSPEEAQQLVTEQADILLTDSAESLIDKFSTEHRDQPDLQRHIAERKSLLLRCRAIGIIQAFAEMEQQRQRTIDAVWALIRVNALGESKNAWQDTKRVVEQNATLLLSDYADQLLGNYLENKQAELEKETIPFKRGMELYPVIEKRELLKRCYQVGIDAAFAERGSRLADDWVYAFLNFSSTSERANNWAVTKNLLQGSAADLLSEQAQQALTGLGLLQSFSSGAKFTLGELFNRIREFGIDATFADLVEFNTDVPLSVRDALRTAKSAKQRYEEKGDRMSLDVAIPAWEAVIGNPEIARSSQYTQRTFLIEAGNTYENRYNERHDLPDLDRAIQLWQLAANETARKAMGDEWSEYLNYLGHSFQRRYVEMGEEARVADLDKAIEYYEQAYTAGEEEISSPPPAPVPTPDGRDAFAEWMWRRRQRARYLTNAGEAYLRRYWRTNNAIDLDHAIERCRASTEWAEKEEMQAPFLFDDLGNALSVRYWNTRQDTDLQAVMAAYNQAIELASKDSRPAFLLEATNHLGQFLYHLGQFKESRRTLEKAHEAVGRTRIERTSQRARLDLARYNANLYATLVSCCLREGDVLAAFEYASSGKGRTFVDMLAESRFDLTAVTNAQPDLYADLQPYLKLRDEIDTVQIIMIQQSMPIRPGEERSYKEYSEDQLIMILEDLRHKEKTLWDDLVSRYPSLAALADVPALTAEEGRALARDLQSTLIEYYRHREGWCAFVVTPEGIQHIPLSLLSDNFLNSMAQWVSAMMSSDERSKPSEELLAKWHAAVIAPMRQTLPTDQTITVAPFGALHLLPLNAAFDPDTGHYVVEDYLLGFAPSLSALSVNWKRARSSSNGPARIGRILGVAYPGIAGHPHFLPNVIPEVQAFLECFPQAQQTALFDGEATPNAVVANSDGQDVIHLSCHGTFDSKFPSQSGLFLSSGWLTVQRIITELKLAKTRLFTMSACVSARADLDAGDELVGLTEAAFAAGAQTVVSSQWYVDDEATRVLLTTFYESVATGLTPVQAMRQAALTLRAEKKWRHPYFWAPFIVSGLGHLKNQIAG